jgi:hypothetical protein
MRYVNQAAVNKAAAIERAKALAPILAELEGVVGQRDCAHPERT